jgi:hypothetical protein
MRTDDANFGHQVIDQSKYPPEIKSLVESFSNKFKDGSIRLTDVQGQILEGKIYKPKNDKLYSGAGTRSQKIAANLAETKNIPILVWYGRLVANIYYPINDERNSESYQG